MKKQPAKSKIIIEPTPSKSNNPNQKNKLQLSVVAEENIEGESSTILKVENRPESQGSEHNLTVTRKLEN